MQYNKYIGHDSQLFGVEEHILVGGKGNGMRLFQVKNGKGLEFTVSADRCADISRLSVDGKNFGYFSPCGYVAPQYYDDDSFGFLKSFTAGFLTTCGLSAVGSPCTDNGEKLPLHGTISHCPADYFTYEITDDHIVIRARMDESTLFGRKMVLNRNISCSLLSNEIMITDTITNHGTQSEPLMLLYHMNLGYPLLDENATLYIPSKKVIPRNDQAARGIGSWDKIMQPEAGFEEQCYYHTFEKEGFAVLYNSKIEKGIVISFDAEKLDYFIEWKMLGQKDYVLGLEPANCHADGRDKMRAEGNLKFLDPGAEINYQVKLTAILYDELRLKYPMIISG